MKQDLVVTCERCGQVQSVPSYSRSAQEIADAEETQVIIDDLKGTETTALLNFRTTENNYSGTGNNLPAASRSCDVCHASLYFPERTFAVRCASCTSLVIRPDAPVREGHKLMRCQNGACHCLFLFLTDSTSFVRCPACQALRSEDACPTVRCQKCFRYFQNDGYMPSYQCPHCSSAIWAGCTLKAFWLWIGAGLVVSLIMFIVIVLYIVAAAGNSSSNWDGFPAVLLCFIGGLAAIAWPVDFDTLEQTLPYAEIQHPEALDETINEQSFFV